MEQPGAHMRRWQSLIRRQFCPTRPQRLRHDDASCDKTAFSRAQALCVYKIHWYIDTRPRQCLEVNATKGGRHGGIHPDTHLALSRSPRSDLSRLALTLETPPSRTRYRVSSTLLVCRKAPRLCLVHCRDSQVPMSHTTSDLVPCADLRRFGALAVCFVSVYVYSGLVQRRHSSIRTRHARAGGWH